jgi:hypothetical protein
MDLCSKCHQPSSVYGCDDGLCYERAGIPETWVRIRRLRDQPMPQIRHRIREHLINSIWNQTAQVVLLQSVDDDVLDTIQDNIYPFTAE